MLDTQMRPLTLAACAAMRLTKYEMGLFIERNRKAIDRMEWRDRNQVPLALAEQGGVA